MRFLIGLIFCVALVPAVSAQQVRLKLHDGQLLLGELVAITDDTIEIKVGEDIVRVTVEEVAEFSEVVVDPAREKPVTETPPTDPPASDPPATNPPPTNSLPTVLQPTVPPVKGQDPPATPGGAAPQPRTPPPVVTGSTRRSRSLYAERLGWIPERYAWITPDDTASLASMLVLFLFVLSGSIHFSTNVANIEYRSFGRSCMLAVVVMVAAGMQIGFVPISPIAVGSMLVGNIVVWMALTAGLFQAPRFSAITMVVVTMLCVLVSFLVLEVVDSIFGMVNNGIAREW